MRHFLVIFLLFCCTVSAGKQSRLQDLSRQQQRELQAKRPILKVSEVSLHQNHGLWQFQNKLSHQVFYGILMMSLACRVMAQTETLGSMHEKENPKAQDLEILPHLPEGQTLAGKVTFKDICTPEKIRVVLQEDFAYISPKSQFDALVTGPLRPCQAIIISHTNASFLWHHSHWGCLQSLPAIYADMRVRFFIDPDDEPKVTIVSTVLDEKAKKRQQIKNIMNNYKEKGLPDEQSELMQALRHKIAEYVAIEPQRITVVVSQDSDEYSIALTKDGHVMNVRLSFLLDQPIVEQAIQERLGKLPDNYLKCREPFAVPEVLEHDEAAENTLACEEYIFFSGMRDLVHLMFALFDV